MSIRDDLWGDPQELCFLLSNALCELGHSRGGQSFCDSLSDIMYNKRDAEDWKSTFLLLVDRFDDVLEEYIEEKEERISDRPASELQHDYREANGYDRS